MNDQHHGMPLDGRTVVAALVDDSLALMVGVGNAFPATMDIYLNNQSDAKVQASVIGWRRHDADVDNAYGFVALLPMKDVSQRRLKTALFHGAGKPREYRIENRQQRIESILSAVADQSGPAFATVIDGVVEALLAGDPDKKRLRKVTALVQSAARSNGFIEVLGGLEEGDVYIQGWSSDFPVGRTRVIAMGENPALVELTSADFKRDDLGDEASGVTGLMMGDKPINPEKLKRVYFRGREAWYSIEVYQQRVLVAPPDVPAHIRSVLDRVRAPENILSQLQMAAHRFDGRDTVSELDRPIRIGIDFALLIEGSGVLVSGWMLDPDRGVEDVSLRVGGEVVRIDDRWTRQSRADVTAAFAQDPMFSGLNPARNNHGFLVFCPLDETPSSDQVMYLELGIRDAFPAYCPLNPTRSSARQALSRVLPSLDPRSVTASNSIEKQFGPMLQGMSAQSPYAVDVHDVGAFDEDAPVALVVGVDDTINDIGVTIALLGLDPATRHLPIIIAGPVESFDQVGSDILRLAAFYKLNTRIVFAEGVEDFCDALEVGVAATNSETVGLVSAHILPRGDGWFDQLYAAYRKRGGKALVSPTILFEDDSVRWAGTWIDGDAKSGQYLSDRYVGYPCAVLDGAEPSEVTAGTIECAILPRKAFDDIGGFTRGYIGPAEKSLDLALKLRMAGTPSYWIPDVEVLGSEQSISKAPAWEELSNRLDRWAFDRRWSLVVSNLRSHNNAVD
ncbi:MAG: glycosyltransferase family 2 protein [Porticoccaceae bacterium]|uniref:glycosyltransferase family 2 protein n=1 Tax=Thalassospira sp. TaxID=1912094 RepID=UPI003A87F923